MTTPRRPFFIGLMSGTSLDGVDGVLARFETNGPQVLAHASTGLDTVLRSELLALNTAGENELHRCALAGNALSRLYAQVTNALLAQANLKPVDVCAIGAHGQTVRHRPELGYTAQLLNGALLAELTGIDVVCDLRSRDVAAGGQGAPLVPAFHRAVFAPPAGTSQTVVVLNVGGISNASILSDDGAVLGFDCGPGNVLLDLWCQRHTGQPFDAGGAWGAGGQVIPALLQSLLAEPWLALPAPKSTGRDLFHATWLEQHLAAFASAPAQDVQRTLVEFTARCCVDLVNCYTKNSNVKHWLVCGGGAFNQTLMAALQSHLSCPVRSTDSAGLPAMQVEAAAFAWLAHAYVHRSPGNLSTVTGAAGPRVLGCLYPA
jgi:anhydro-N-acetylmuramic acid kinase